jgi:hypothetical protein
MQGIRVQAEVRARRAVVERTKSRPAVRRARRAEQEHTRLLPPRRPRRLVLRVLAIPTRRVRVQPLLLAPATQDTQDRTEGRAQRVQ